MQGKEQFKLISEPTSYHFDFSDYLVGSDKYLGYAHIFE